jgi:hypothetical protein
MDFDVGHAMDGLSILVIANSIVIVALVTLLAAIDYFAPISDARLGGIYPVGTSKL